MSGLNGTAPVSTHKIALGRMLFDAEDAAELGAMIDPSSMPDKASRHLFAILARDGPKGPSASILKSAIEVEARDCIPLLTEIEAGMLDAVRDESSNDYIAQRVADEGRRARLARSATETLAAIKEGKPTDEILSRNDQQRAAMELGGDRGANRFRFRDDEELATLPPPKWLIEGIIPDDATVAIVGPSGSFKSFLALDWCYHIRTGLDWHGHRTTVGECIYLCGEGANGQAKRSAAWKAQNNLTGRLGVHFLTNGLDLNNPAEVATLISTIEARRIKPRFIVIDTLARFLVGDENTAKDMGGFIRSADALRIRFGCTVVIVHHTGKDIGKGGRGSNSLFCAIDTEITVDREAGEMAMTLTVSKQKDGPDGAKYTVEAVAIAGSLALRPSKPFGGKLAGKNLSCLLALSEHDEGTGLKYGDWLERSTLAKGTFDKARTWLKESGYTRLDKARYSVNEAGRLALLSTRSTQGLPSGLLSPVSLSTSEGVYSTPGIDKTSAQDLTEAA